MHISPTVDLIAASGILPSRTLDLILNISGGNWSDRMVSRLSVSEGAPLLRYPKHLLDGPVGIPHVPGVGGQLSYLSVEARFLPHAYYRRLDVLCLDPSPTIHQDYQRRYKDQDDDQQRY